ncbi:MAG: hypothetical protein AAGA87_02960 [Pseudomonadota bacterium]
MAAHLPLQRIHSSIASRVATRSFRVFEQSKRCFNEVVGVHPSAGLLILGCQRSGTTHLERLFRADMRSVIFSEFSDLSFDPGSVVWVDLSDVQRRLARAPGRYVVVRSLFASHRAVEILDSLRSLRVIWMIRPAAEVVASMISKWGDRFEAISRRVETDDAGDWDLASLWGDVHNEAQRLSTAERGTLPYQRDVYALYWHARNRTFFDLGLESDSRVRVLSYQTLLDDPMRVMADLRQDIGVSDTSLRFPLRTQRRTPKAAAPDLLSPMIRETCDALYARLLSVEARVEPC